MILQHSIFSLVAKPTGVTFIQRKWATALMFSTESCNFPLHHHFLFATALEVKAGGGARWPLDPISGIKPRVNPSAVHRTARHGQRPWGSACRRRRRRRLACPTPAPGARQDRQKDVRLLPLSSLPTPRSTSFADPDSNSAFLILVEMGGKHKGKEKDGRSSLSINHQFADSPNSTEKSCSKNLSKFAESPNTIEKSTPASICSFTEVSGPLLSHTRNMEQLRGTK